MGPLGRMAPITLSGSPWSKFSRVPSGKRWLAAATTGMRWTSSAGCGSTKPSSAGTSGRRMSRPGARLRSSAATWGTCDGRANRHPATQGGTDRAVGGLLEKDGPPAELVPLAPRPAGSSCQLRRGVGDLPRLEDNLRGHMNFYLGTHKPRWLWKTNVPLFVSRRRLAELGKLYPATCDWALDSGGFTEIQDHGKWTVSSQQYIEEVQRWQAEVGRLQFAAVQDWMCEPFMVVRTGL